MGRICKNHITDHIRDQFGANPIKVPEARIQPLTVVEIRKDKPTYLGEFKFLVKGGFNHALPSNETLVAAVSDTRTKATDFEAGFDILGGFLKGLGVDPASVTASMSKSKKMAFKFSNVRRRFIDVLQLGQILSDNPLLGDVNNFVLQPAMTDKKVKLALITDVIVSNNFSLSALSESETAVEIDVPAIEGALANLNTSVKVKKSGANEVQFEGPSDLTFAFTCFEIKIDPVTGKFSRGDWMRNLKSAAGEARSLDSLEPGEEHLLERLLIDNNTEYPLLIEF